MRGFGRPEAMAVSVAFEAFLNEVATTANAAERQRMLHDWEDAPGARLAHPREDHLLPFMVAAGAAGDDPGARLYLDKVMNVVMASYRFGA